MSSIHSSSLTVIHVVVMKLFNVKNCTGTENGRRDWIGRRDCRRDGSFLLTFHLERVRTCLTLISKAQNYPRSIFNITLTIHAYITPQSRTKAPNTATSSTWTNSQCSRRNVCTRPIGHDINYQTFIMVSNGPKTHGKLIIYIIRSWFSI
jgi:hypothetical protein